MEAFMLHLLPIFLWLCHVTKTRLSLHLWMLPTFSSVPLALLFTLYLKLPDSHLCSYPWYKLKKCILYICHRMAKTSVRVSLTITTSLKMESARHSPEPCQQWAGCELEFLQQFWSGNTPSGKASAADQDGHENQENKKCYFRKAQLS